MDTGNYSKDVHKQSRLWLQKIMGDLEGGTLDLDLYNDFQTELKDHIFEEETFIFKMFKENGKLKNEILGLETEHAAMWRLTNLINSEIETKRFQKIEKYFDELFRILTQHNEREEQLIYSNLADSIHVAAKRPQDWVCRKLKS